MFVDGQKLRLGGPRQLAVLARLMLSPGQVVSMDQLVASVWDGDTPARPDVTVRSYISHLRRQLDPDRKTRSSSSCLVSSPPGYRLDVKSAQIDWMRFEAVVRGSRRMLDERQFDESVEALRVVLKLWRGDPCSGVPNSTFFETHRVRLLELRRIATENLYEAQLGAGDHVSVAAGIEASIEANPLRERLTEIGMVALYRSGRQSEALALGQSLRKRLVNELGVDPGPGVTGLETQILTHDPALRHQGSPDNVAEITQPVPTRFDTPLPALSPGQPIPVGSEASKPVAPVVSGKRRANRVTHRPKANASRVPAQSAQTEDMPFSNGRPSLVGRHKERSLLADASGLLSSGRPAHVVVTGETGAGKSALIDEFVRSLGPKVAVSWAQCLDSEIRSPLWAWNQHDEHKLTESDLADPETGVVENPLSGQAGALLAAKESIRKASFDQPLVFVFEDVQWADSATLSLIEFCAHSLKSRPIGFVLSWTSGFTADRDILSALRRLARLPRLVRIDLNPLSLDEVGQIVANRELAANKNDIARLLKRGGGNPLFTHELLSAVAGTELSDVDRITPNLVDIVLGIVERLGEFGSQLLSLVAEAEDNRFSLDELVERYDFNPAEIGAHIDAALNSGLLVPVRDKSDRYSFRHEIIAEVLNSQRSGSRSLTKRIEQTKGHVVSLPGA